MITLGLDPSLTGFGWCVHRSDTAGPARVVAKGVFSTSSKQVFIWRYMFLRESVGRLLDVYPEVTALGVETPPFGEQYSEGLYGLFLYVMEAVFSRRKDIVFFDPLTVKLLTKMDPKVRRGTMDKRDMIDAAKTDTGIPAWNHNEADAYLIARSAARFWSFLSEEITEEDLTPSEKHSFARIHKIKKGWRAGQTVGKGLVYKENDRYFQFSLLSDEDTEVQVSFDRQV